MDGQKKKWLKWIGITLLSPLILLVILLVLLYLPPVQNVLKNQFVKYASRETGMHISIDRIRLSFPLDLAVHEVSVISSKDTLLIADKMIVDLGLRRIFHRELRVDDITLSKVFVNSSNLMEGMRIRGKVGKLYLCSEKVNLKREEALVTDALLKDADLKLSLIDTTKEKKEKPSKPFRWKIFLQRLQLRNVAFHMDQPADSLRLTANVNGAVLTNGKLDFMRRLYKLRHFSVEKASFNYDSGAGEPSKGFDPSHLALRDISITVDSFMKQDRELQASIKRVSLWDRSGLSITSLTGRILADNRAIRIPAMLLNTPHSEVNLTAKADWLFVENPDKGSFESSVVSNIGKQDVLLFVGGLSKQFSDSYPFRAITLRALVQGNKKSIRLSRFSAVLPGSFSLASVGEMRNLSDKQNRSGQIKFQMDAKNLDFMANLIKSSSNGNVRVPLNMKLQGQASMKGERYLAGLTLTEDKGTVKADAEYNMANNSYNAKVSVDKLQVNHFLPKNTIYSLTASFDAAGEGTDFFSAKTKLNGGFKLQELQYDKSTFTGIDLKAKLQNSLAEVVLKSESRLLKMDANLTALLHKKLTKSELTMYVRDIDLYRLRFIKHPLKDPIAFTVNASTNSGETSLELHSGDMELSLNSRIPIKNFIKEATNLSTIITKQIQQKRLNHQELSEAIPSAQFSFMAGKKNPLSEYLAFSKISFQDASVNLTSTQKEGLAGGAQLHSLQVDSVLLDTVRLAIRQDTAGIHLHAGVINNKFNKQYVFQAYADGVVQDDNAEVMLKYLNAKGETGADLGIRAQLEEGGVSYNLFPDQPILLFRPFKLNKDNRIFIDKENRVTANLDLQDKNGMGLFVHSVENAEAQQDIIGELRNLDLKEVVQSLPYLPDIGGILSAKAEYIQKNNRFQVIADAGILKCMYENQLVGNMNLQATYLPVEKNVHQLEAKLGYNGREVLVADGTYHAEGEGTMKVLATLKAFPLGVANAFIPDGMAKLSGALNGEVALEGSTQSPKINGGFKADTSSVYIPQAGARLRLDEKEIKVTDNKLVFDNYHIYAVGKNPLNIVGTVDMKDLQQMRADLKLTANNYQLFNANRTKQSLVYGKLFVDLNTTIRGPVDALVMRGNMRLLGNTDATYVLKDSPLTVQDRLGDMVTFVNFADTLQPPKEKPKKVSLGGLDMLINIQVEPAVRLKADLSPDRQNRVELEGGGDLSLQYTPQGDMLLYGRYTLSGGLLNYTLPVIPLKEFAIKEGSYVEWSGNMMDPKINFKASERLRASVTGENQTSRQVNFDVSVSIKNTLKNLGMVFDLEAPEDMTVQNQLSSMSDEERSKLAITMLVSGMYMPQGITSSGTGGGINVGSALNNFLQGEIANIAGSALKKVDISFGMESYDEASGKGTGKRTDYSYRFAKRFYNDRIRIVIGGKISTGETVEEKQSFIDNISLEYRLDNSGTRYVKLFHNKNYQSLLEGEIIETGVGVVLRKKMRRLGELFIFKSNKDKKESK
ncbi:Family of unknown function [Bacteroides luti]|uniref:Translocation and assembly module TamB C-terminal domain-containing protein n=1 Tax=Bacteroides luti TaxID=1297750 RepID=A0A1M5EZE8_9BACE|nr:translocation/assembly module TamB domain-containing protein [Bacteroides luti]SHF84382.1 Family of unknown function [Bacteroides luti]